MHDCGCIVHLGVMSRWCPTGSRDEEGDMYEGDVAMTLAGSDVLVDRLGV